MRVVLPPICKFSMFKWGEHPKFHCELQNAQELVVNSEWDLNSAPTSRAKEKKQVPEVCGEILLHLDDRAQMSCRDLPVALEDETKSFSALQGFTKLLHMSGGSRVSTPVKLRFPSEKEFALSN